MTNETLEKKTIETRKFDVAVEHGSNEWNKILKSVHETECRLSILSRFIKDPDTSENVAMKMTEEYVEASIRHENLVLDYLKTLIPEDCLGIVNWMIDTDNNIATICGNFEVK